MCENSRIKYSHLQLVACGKAMMLCVYKQVSFASQLSNEKLFGVWNVAQDFFVSKYKALKLQIENLISYLHYYCRVAGIAYYYALIPYLNEKGFVWLKETFNSTVGGFIPIQ